MPPRQLAFQNNGADTPLARRIIDRLNRSAEASTYVDLIHYPSDDKVPAIEIKVFGTPSQVPKTLRLIAAAMSDDLKKLIEQSEELGGYDEPK